MALRDSHRLFLQSFMSRGILPSKEVRQLYQQACERFGGKCLIKYTNLHSCHSVVTVIFSTVDILNMKIENANMTMTETAEMSEAE